MAATHDQVILEVIADTVLLSTDDLKAELAIKNLRARVGRAGAQPDDRSICMFLEFSAHQLLGDAAAMKARINVELADLGALRRRDRRRPFRQQRMHFPADEDRVAGELISAVRDERGRRRIGDIGAEPFGRELTRGMRGDVRRISAWRTAERKRGNRQHRDGVSVGGNGAAEI